MPFGRVLSGRRLPLTSDKTVLISKTIADRDTSTSVRLGTLLQGEQDKRLFVKMDIEGAEMSVLEASREFLKEALNIQLACCTYHRASDAANKEKIFRDMGYSTEYSDG